jgi:carbohydrate kinase (thermoresistant glucokinase family)
MPGYIIFIMGVSGSGKTTIGELLSQRTGIPFFDADDFHSVTNKEKMRSGLPLNDEDRSGWLQKINDLAAQQVQGKGAIIACSALKEKYRSILCRGITKPQWIFLEGSYSIIYNRMKKREGHYMPASLLKTQFDSLEIPGDSFSVDIQKMPEEIVELICRKINATGRDT